MQTIKTANNACVSSLTALAGSSDLKIGCVSVLEKYKDEYAPYAKAVPHPQDSVGLNQRFFYKVQEYEIRNNEKTLVVGECGVGEIYKKRKSFFLRRHFALRSFDNSSSYKPRDGALHEFSTFIDYLILESYRPADYHEALASPYSVLCSIEQNTPSPVELQEKTLLGRLDDRIQSIDAQELRQILNGDTDTYLKLTDKELEHVFKNIKNTILKALRGNTSAISTKSQKIDLLTAHSSVAAPIIQAKPEYTDKKKPTKPRAGMIIFNKDKKAFEGYDGNSWKRLSWD
jgi:hypothetical protein